MKRFELGNTVAIVANLGVIAGLILLAVELQQNNEVLEAQSRDVWVDRRVAINETLALNPDLLELLIKGAHGSEHLTDIERHRVRAIGLRTFAVWEHMFIEMRRGRLSENEVISLQQTFNIVDGHNLGTRLAWEEYKGNRATPEYRSWFEEKVVGAP